MNNQLQITNVKKIINIEKPIIVFEVEGHERGIARTPKQALLDFQNSFRLDESVTNVKDARFNEALRKSIGGTVSGDIKFFKAGDEYVVEEGHPALTNPDHDYYGKVKEGDTLKASTDGCWVTGFLNVQYSQTNNMIDAVSKEVASGFLSLFGGLGNMNMPGMANTATPQIEIVGDDEPEKGKETKGKK